jgi:Rad3-related DNA helicase
MWRPYFPLKEPRPDQARALDQLCEDALAGKRVLLAELGTGVGKSAIAVTMAGWLASIEEPVDPYKPGAVVLTSQKILQDQYVKDFSHARDLRSAANFPCVHPKLGPTSAATSRVRTAFMKVQGETFDPRLACSSCPYREAKKAFAEGPLGITNYSYFFSESVYAGQLPKRHLLVLDEAHNIEDEVRRWATVNVDWKDAGKLNLELPKFGTSPQKLIDWLGGEYKKTILDKMEKVAKKLIEMFGKNLGPGALEKIAEDNEMLDKRLCQINRILDKGGTILTNWDQGGQTISYQPLEVAGLANDILYSQAQRVLLMSATILDKDVFTRSAGLPADAGFISIPTPFSPKSFGVHFRPVGKMSRQGIDQSLPLIGRAIKRILDAHPNEKGIIHTANYEITKEVGKITNKRLLVQKNANDRKDIINRHMKSPDPTVIVSPGMTEGLDLRDDLGRFQIICKVPYPNMGDPVVKAKMSSDREWYNWRTVRALAQAMGRCVRSETDFTATYILDECYLDMLEKWGHMFPKHLTSDMEMEEPF